MTYTRKEAIKFLVDLDIDDISQAAANNDFTFVTSILNNGFEGYDNISNIELRDEIQQRALEGSEEVEII
jgi:hypothetical protein